MVFCNKVETVEAVFNRLASSAAAVPALMPVPGHGVKAEGKAEGKGKAEGQAERARWPRAKARARFRVGRLHGRMDQASREAALRDLASGKLQVRSFGGASASGSPRCYLPCVLPSQASFSAGP